MVTIGANGACQQLFARLTPSHLAASLLLAASALANFKYGTSLGQTALESWIAGIASIGADLWNAVGLILVAWAASTRQWGKAAAAGLVLACTMLYSVNAGISFAASAKEEIVGKRTAEIRADKSLEADLQRTDTRLKELGSQRPTGTIASESAAIIADPKAEGCKSINGSYTKQHCPRYFRLQSELALAQERERLLEASGALRARLQTTETVATADPTGSTVVTYLTLVGIEAKPENIRPWQTLLFVVIVVLGGPVGLWLAESRLEARGYTRVRIEPANENQPDRDAQQTSVESDIRGIETDPAPLPVVRGRKLEPVTPLGDTALKKIRAAGGTVKAKSHTQLAAKLKIPRTSFRRVVDRLEATGMIQMAHGPDGYSIKLAA